ncbi:hypothetical protein evm_004647 [Chilo suppressalis]|nr:hypothetical protein evm_004647 [Chilo suppressalis]
MPREYDLDLDVPMRRGIFNPHLSERSKRRLYAIRRCLRLGCSSDLNPYELQLCNVVAWTDSCHPSDNHTIPIMTVYSNPRNTT